jgi:hypothetical protein
MFWGNLLVSSSKVKKSKKKKENPRRAQISSKLQRKPEIMNKNPVLRTNMVFNDVVSYWDFILYSHSPVLKASIMGNSIPFRLIKATYTATC